MAAPPSPPTFRSIPWEELTPQPATLVNGGMGVVMKCTWTPSRGIPRVVAVKTLKAENVAEGALEREAAMIYAACDAGANDFVIGLLGIARGDAPSAWTAGLGRFLPACLVPSDAQGSGAGAGGGASGSLFGLVMRWEEGGTLDELLHSPTRAWGAGTPERLLLCAQVALGVSGLHNCASGTLIHGDLKAQNVLLSCRPGAEGAAAQLHPRISDFGFSELRAAGRQSRASSIMQATVRRGTWEYMAPEMYKTGVSPALKASRATDVFALGTLFWEILSGKIPWEGDSEVDRQLALEEGESLDLGSSALPVDTPAEVKVLLAACLAYNREARPSISRVVEVLHMEAQSMSSGKFDVFLSHAWDGNAHAPLTTEVYLRLLDAGLRVWLDKAEMGANLVESMKKGVAASGCVVALLDARYAKSKNCKKELELAREQKKAVVACLADSDGAWSLSRELADLVGTITYLFPDLRAAAAVDWVPANGEVPAAQREVLTKAPDALPKVLRLVREELGRAGVGAQLGALAAAADPAQLMGVGAGGSAGQGNGAVAQAADALPENCFAQLRHGGSATGLAVVGGQLVSGGLNQYLRIWDLGTGNCAARLTCGGWRIATLSGMRFATAPGNAPTAAVWDASTATRISELQGHTGDINCVASLSSDHLATGSADKTVRIWHGSAGTLIGTLEGHTGSVLALALSPDGRLASGSADKTVRLWDLSTRLCTAELQHGNIILALAVLEQGMLASGCADNKIYLWNPVSGAREALMEGHASSVLSLAALPRSLLASGSRDTTVRVWNVAAHSCVAVLQGHTKPVCGLVALPDGHLASGSNGDAGVICLWDVSKIS